MSVCWDPLGPLPPGVTPDTLVAAYRLSGFRPKPLLGTFGIRTGLALTPAGRIRSALDNPRHRSAKARRRPLHQVLYDWLRADPDGARAYASLVQPAEYDKEQQLFLDPDRFQALLAQRLTAEPAAQAQGFDLDALALFVVAFGLLQPADAQRLVEALLKSAPSLRPFFFEPPASKPAPEVNPVSAPFDDVVSALRVELDELRDSLEEAVSRAARGIAPPVDLGPRLSAYCDRHSQAVRQVMADAPEDVLEVSLDQLQEAIDADSPTDVDESLRRVQLVCRLDGRGNVELDRMKSDCAETSAGAVEATEADRRRAGASQLLRLVANLETLGDAELESLRQVVESVFGERVARQASRGLLTLAEATGAPAADHDSSATDTTDASAPAPPEVANQTSELADTADAPAPEPTQEAPAAVEAPSVEGDATEPPEPPAPVDLQSPSDEATEQPQVTQEDEPASSEGGAPANAEPGPDVEATTATAPARLQDLLADAFTAGRWSSAYHLSEAGESDGADLVPAAAVGVAALSPHVRLPIGELADRFTFFVGELFEQAEHLDEQPAPLGPAVRSLVSAAMVGPALLAPRTTGGILLEQLAVPAPSIHEVGVLLRRFSQLGLEWTPGLLAGVKEHAAWKAAQVEYREEVARLLDQERHVKIIYAPTTDVWREWMKPGGMLGQHLERICSGAPDDDLAGVIRAWGDPAYVEDQLVRSDHALRGRVAGLRPIEARAKRALLKHAAMVVKTMADWTALVASEPSPTDEFRLREADACRTELQRVLPAAIQEMNELAGSTADRLAVACYAAAAALLRSTMDLFGSAPGIPLEPPTVKGLLHADLLAVPGLDLDDAWEPVSPAALLVKSIAALPLSGPLDWEQALERQSEYGDHTATERILEVLEARRGTSERLVQLRKSREETIRQERKQLAVEVARVQRRVDHAVMLDLLTETELLGLRASLDGIEPDACLNFASARATLRNAEGALDRAEMDRAGVIGERLSAARSNIGESLVTRIEEALARRDFFVANELIDAAEEGRHLPEVATEDPFESFFPAFIRNVTEYLGKNRTDARDLIGAVSAQRSVGPIELTHVPKAQAAEAGRMLEAWYTLKSRRSGKDGLGSVRELFETLGFDQVQVKHVSPRPDDRRWWLELRTTPVNDRAACVIPSYGSQARGLYRVLCVWDRPSEEELFTLVSGSSQQSPLFVLYLGQMTEQRRRDLASLSRGRRRSFVVLDECLLMFLCSVRGSRLSVMFRCGFPFTVGDPYVTTASLVPAEMFFGRASERAAVVDPFGTNLVFGGRQLGKTALLRDIERRHHEPSAGQVVRWIDLLPERLGESKPASDIWNVIAAELRKWQIVPQPTTTPEKLGRRVRDWLAENTDRRIVLLLDEADAFLESDSREGFEQLTALKALMDTTERRFKVVFSGLHNVQRASRDPNTPLAHLGQPVCIGPLLNQRDAQEALALVKMPLESLGYRFESDDLPLRVLSYTNYYPSLIQIYCRHLLEYLSEPGRQLFDPRQTPPFVVTSKHLDSVQNSELREKILEKFRLTLNLDPRYRVIALCMAVAAKAGDGGARTLVEGVEPLWVRDEALYWWPAGFKSDKTIEGFRVLLDEMIGLGILRKVDGRQYALRSPNLVTLLGTEAEISEGLLDAADQQPRPQYEAATFRRTGAGGVWERSPLTAQQEMDIVAPSNGIVVVCGSRLAGSDRLDAFLRLACDGVGFEDAMDLTDASQLQARLLRVFERDREGLTVVSVPSLCPWTEKWVERAQDILSRKTSKKRFVRVVFEAAPKDTWIWIRQRERRSRLVTETVLRQWSDSALHRWMTDSGLAAGDSEARRQILESTGGWGYFLLKLAERCSGGESHRWRDHLNDIVAEARTPRAWTELVSGPEEARAILRSMAQIAEPVSADVLADLAGTPVERVRPVLAWADLLSFVAPVTKDEWRIDPIVSALVS